MQSGLPSGLIVPENGVFTTPSPGQKQQAVAWFEGLRNQICAAFEGLEDVYAAEKGGVAGRFCRKAWQRAAEGEDGGGGVMAQMHGQVFEKVGVNVSTVYGHFSQEFRQSIPGSEGDGRFWATGISLVAHLVNPHAPPVHMNTRHIVTSRGWFGGGADLNPIFPDATDTHAFHAALKAACDHHDSRYYGLYKAWCDRYFFIKHRNEPRGVGGIFYDYHDSGNWEADFAFTQDVGRAFLAAYPPLVQKQLFTPWSAADKEAQSLKRGRYVEFNLVYDRGTKFGLMTGGNVEAILMSLPPEAKWA